MDEPRFTIGDYEILTENGQELCIRRSDGASIPICPGNRDYDEYRRIDPAGKCRQIDIGPDPADLIRAARDAVLKESDLLLIRHLEQERLLAAGDLQKTALSTKQVLTACRLRQELRDLPASGLSIEEQETRIVEIRDDLQAARTATIEQEAVRKE